MGVYQRTRLGTSSGCDSKFSISVRNTESSTVDVIHFFVHRQRFSGRRDTANDTVSSRSFYESEGWPSSVTSCAGGWWAGLKNLLPVHGNLDESCWAVEDRIWPEGHCGCHGAGLTGGRTMSIVVYYESMKREVKTRPIYECRCDERLKTKAVYHERPLGVVVYYKSKARVKESM